jgi:CheY-like chemotaxis protein
VLALTPFTAQARVRTAVGHRIAGLVTSPLREAQLLKCLTGACRHGAPDADAPAALARRAARRVLIADDNAVNQKLAVRLVERAGLIADVVSNGEEAVRAARERRYELILMDCQMPQMDGFEATARVRELEGTVRRTPIVAMTAHANQGDRERCLDAGMDDYISKPVKMDELTAVLARWLEVPAPQPA